MFGIFEIKSKLLVLFQKENAELFQFMYFIYLVYNLYGRNGENNTFIIISPIFVLCW